MRDRQPTAQSIMLAPDRRTGKGVFAKAVGSFVPKVTSAVFQKFGFHSAEIMSSWSTIVGPDLARLTRPQSIKWPRGRAGGGVGDEEEPTAGATLMLGTDPAFALEVSYRHREIIDRINRYFGYRAIGQIKVQQVPRITESPTSAAPVSAQALGPVVVGTGDLAAALEALGRSVAANKAR